MTDLPLVSVLMPVYNHERFVVEAIHSALEQGRDYPPERLDIVLVDDGSTDATPTLIEPYGDRIRAIRKPNGGVLSTVNRLLEEARGELICFLAGDDCWRPGKVARQAGAMAARPWVSISYGDAAMVDGEGRVEHPSYYELHGLTRAVGDIRGPLLEKNFVCAPTAMIRASPRERFWPIGPPAAWEDWWMWWHAAEAGEALYIPGADVCYRTHGANMSAGLDAERRQRFTATELPFRRWLLCEPDHTGIPYGDVLDAWRAFEWHAHECVAAGLGSFEELVPIGERERAAGAAALAAVPAVHDDPAGCVRGLLRTLAWDPHCVPARAALEGAMAEAERAAPALSTSRSVVLALATELVRDPRLLAAFVEAFDEHDEVVLIADARGWSAERVATEIVPLAEELGVLDAGPEVVVLDDGRGWPRARLRAVLTTDAGTAEALGGPQATDASSLRETIPSVTR
jgi:glycosyltransferase involved in cell wall biosynthesis